MPFISAEYYCYFCASDYWGDALLQHGKKILVESDCSNGQNLVAHKPVLKNTYTEEQIFLIVLAIFYTFLLGVSIYLIF